MRTKKAIFNSTASLLLQFVNVISGFILPQMIISAFGSEVNGAASSVAQFLGYISLLEAGVGGVTRAALFRPLAQNDTQKISGIVNATQAFFRKLAYIFLAYSLLLAVGFKYISRSGLDWSYTFALVLILSISTFAQYFFGITNSIILQADQLSYIPSVIQIVAVILNTMLAVLLLKLGCGFLMVKFVTAAIFTVKPAILNYIVCRRYKLDRAAPPDYDAISQRWNGLGQHLAFFVHNNTDVMVITLFMGLKWVSVYSVYCMILNGVRNIVKSLTGSAEAAFGNMIAREEKQVLQNRFCMMETLTSMIVVSFFSTAAMLLFDFLRIYTREFRDMDYIILPVGILFVLSEALHSIKQTYHSLVLAAGHYKETQTSAFIEAGVNLVLSVALVFQWGVAGVLAATIVSTIYKIIYYVFYLKRNILFRPVHVFLKRMGTDILCAASVILVCRAVPFPAVNNYFEWVVKAVPVFGISGCIVLAWNVALYKKDVTSLFQKVTAALRRS